MYPRRRGGKHATLRARMLRMIHEEYTSCSVRVLQGTPYGGALWSYLKMFSTNDAHAERVRTAGKENLIV